MPRTERAEMEICDLELQQRQGSAQWSCRRAVIIFLTITGFLQITSSLALLLHLTGHLPQADSSAELQTLPEDLLTEPVSAATFRDAKASTDVKSERKHKNIMPAAHLPIKPVSGHIQRKIHATIIHWYPEQGNLQHFGYNNGRVLVQKSGLYYVYAKTCFRYYDLLENGHSNESPTSSPFDKGVQLIQYVFVERLSYSSTLRTTLLMKSGNTFQWKRGTYHMCCQQQSGVFSLQAGEGLYVSVSNSWMLDPEAEGSYFGAFRVSSEV
ncbi:tumor necrosis factor ligand superfamily member 11 [Astyanax mexicanus]|uniref:Tumor necrosis factor ligand superfamily member 11-like n=1 Tax=Astyanax mexicanus TaxID=7994 RepID=A0A8B9JNE3_ASTMX|nr:tumor necrosis factor ligand superfamily member 11 [Astyanax mexicanus]KAG9277879.1 tumor necrosis factor ligand superfamily member 11-like [Astyanax mexicanus]